MSIASIYIYLNVINEYPTHIGDESWGSQIRWWPAHPKRSPVIMLVNSDKKGDKCPEGIKHQSRSSMFNRG